MNARPTLSLLYACLLACSSDSGGDSAGGTACGEDPRPSAGASCPEACTGGCAEGTCTIDCRGPGMCDGRTIRCPSDLACRVLCEGGDACDTSAIECPKGHACELQCLDGTDACGDVVLECNDASSCTFACSATPVVCTGSTMSCGSGQCTATCEGASSPDVVCGDACGCTPCQEGSSSSEGGTEGGGSQGGTSGDATGDATGDAAGEEGSAGSTGTGAAESEGGSTGGAVEPPSCAELPALVTAYKDAHPGNGGKDWDINEKTDAELMADPKAQVLMAVCGPDQRPIYPQLAWEYGGGDHSWIMPEASAIYYCVYTPVDPATEHWRYDGGQDHVDADVRIGCPEQNPCKDEIGADQVLACLGDPSNIEILVDTASYHDGLSAGFDLSEASSDLWLILADDSKVHLYTGL